MTTILLVRHCEAFGNKMRVFQGHTDSEISENGKLQLQFLALRCRNMNIETLYSSPLKRARLTAEAINQYHHLPLHIEPGLSEIDGGEWEGKPWADFPYLNPEQARRWNQEPWRFEAPGGESMRCVYDRIWNTVIKIVEKERGKTICIASHGCAIRNFLCRAQGWPIERLNDVDWCDNTALSKITFDNMNIPNVVFMNDASHLPENLSTFAKQVWWRKENRNSNVFE